MEFTSTRQNISVQSAQAIARGISADGGLFVPCSFPRLDMADINELAGMDYIRRAEKILSLYLTDYTEEEIKRCVAGAYTGTFENDTPAPLKEVEKGAYMLELWHGPTCAFKDMALQLLPFLLTTAAAKTANGKTMVILVATSGDTGKAALEGFADVPDTKIIVFYPSDGVSAMQKLQMTTQEGGNVAVCGIVGNFDDAQTGVKEIFADADIRKMLSDKNMEFSSANSINFGRLVPQVIYYISAYCDLIRDGMIAPGEQVNVTVPTGNFGNILAAYYAKQMGLPIKKFICASNRNNILTDFIATGVYDRNRAFYTTESPSMDILISSNLERLLYHLYNKDCAKIAGLMDSLKKEGKYQISEDVFAKLSCEFAGGCCDDEETRATIREIFEKDNYLCDTHTAVAVNVYKKYRAASGDDTPCIIASTASPYKFAPAVLGAVDGSAQAADDFQLLDMLSARTGVKVPEALASLKGKAPKHTSVVPKEDMRRFIRDFLAL